MRRDELQGVLRPFEQATPLPRAAFVDPAVLELEERAIFASTWIPVAHEDDLARPGDWVRAPLRGEQVIVLRRADLELGALHATCTHRGTLLCEGDGGQFPELEIRCPYHGWSYATDGRLLAAPGARPGGPLPGLAEARVETRAGVVFLNLDEDATGVDASW